MEDLKGLFLYLESSGHIIKKKIVKYDYYINNLNLNYFKSFYKMGRFISPKHPQYKKNYEINKTFKMESLLNPLKLSITDFLMFNRVRYFAVVGFAFERRTETLDRFKKDLRLEIKSQDNLIKNLLENFDHFQKSPDNTRDFINLIEKNNFGFFYTKRLINDLLTSLILVRDYMQEHTINNITMLLESLKHESISHHIGENIILKDKLIQTILFNKILPGIFRGEEDIEELIFKFQHFEGLIEVFFRLKIFNLDWIISILKNPVKSKKIYNSKKAKFNASFKDIKTQSITASDLDDLIDFYTQHEPPIITPIMTNTFGVTNFATYFARILIKKTPKAQKTLTEIKNLFPRILEQTGKDIFTNEDYIAIDLFSPNTTKNDKEILLSFLITKFGENIIKLKRYFFSGRTEAMGVKDFYDFENHEFFYTPDLFRQLRVHSRKIFGKKQRFFIENRSGSLKKLWPQEFDMNYLTTAISKRASKEKIDLDPDKLSSLILLHKNILKIIQGNDDEIRKIKKELFFKTYIKSMKFKPKWEAFGLSEYNLYIRPINFGLIDFKLLLANSFRTIKYAAHLEGSSSFLIKYVFPHRTPNLTYLNWLAKSKKNISEYCLFRTKKIYQIFHFDKNIYSKKWELDGKLFKVFAELVLFKDKFKNSSLESLGIKEFKLEDLDASKRYGPDAPEFQFLTDLCGRKCVDLKSILATNKHSELDKLSLLLEKGLIFPYLRLKNIGLIETIQIILPDIKRNLIEPVIKIFSFFNLAEIYEIEGELFTYNYPELKETKFHSGLLINIHLPDAPLQGFQKEFVTLLRYLEVEKYLILSDQINGTSFINHIFKEGELSKKYNPLKNFEWNGKDKKWMNFKLFNKKHDPLYPDLT